MRQGAARPNEAPGPSDTRREQRVEVLIESVLGSSRFGRRQVWMHDLSAHGCRVESGLCAPSGTHLVLTIPGLAPLGCNISWSRNRMMGLLFTEPVHPLVLARLAGELQRPT